MITFACTGPGRPGEAGYHDPAPADMLAVAFPRPPGKRRRGRNAGLELRCPVCGLTRRLGYKAQRRIADAGLTGVDISALPS
jgi:hypothetical protein